MTSAIDQIQAALSVADHDDIEASPFHLVRDQDGTIDACVTLVQDEDDNVGFDVAVHYHIHLYPDSAVSDDPAEAELLMECDIDRGEVSIVLSGTLLDMLMAVTSHIASGPRATYLRVVEMHALEAAGVRHHILPADSI